MMVSSVSHVQKVPLGLPPTAARGQGPARLLSVLFESRYSVKKPVSRRQLRDHLRSMIMTPPGEQSRKVVDELECLGWGVVGWLRKFGVKVLIMDPESFRSPHGPRWGGLYDHTHRAVYLQERRQNDTAIHEMAHALDHSLGAVGRVRLARHPAVSPMLWHGFAPQRRGFVTDYASTNPAEYFAESFAAVFDPVGSRELRRVDPGMHAFATAIVDLSKIF